MSFKEIKIILFYFSAFSTSEEEIEKMLFVLEDDNQVSLLDGC